MSDGPQGDSWWQANDGKWYAPELAHLPPPPPNAAAVEPDAEPTPDGATAPSRPRKGIVLLGAGVVAAIVVAGGWVLLKPDPEPTMPGPDALGVSFSLLSFDEDDVSGTNGSCSGTGGYSDFGPGMDIKVRNQDGKIIGSGATRSLEDLQVLEPEYFESMDFGEDFNLADDVVFCQVVALVELSETAEFYDVEIGRRGTTSYSYDDLEESDWELGLSLGL